MNIKTLLNKTCKYGTMMLMIMLLYLPVHAQVIVSGTVKDAANVAIPGVNIIVKGTTTGTTTDSEGKYSIQVSETNSTLIFSAIGYSNQEVSTSNKSVIDIILEEDVKSLSEVVVVGYGTKRKGDITSAVSVVDLNEVKDVPAVNTSRLLLGQAPGVNVIQNTGRPGNDFDIVIRGLGSLGAASSPLYVVDGFAIGTSTDLSINPSDIESITVLKDAASTAIYGARGSNGVILITTKNAKTGKTSISFNAATGIQGIPESRKTKMLNAVEFGQFQKESFIDRFKVNNGRDPLESEIPIGIRNPENYTTSTNWFDEILNKAALFQKYDLSISSGNQKTNSMISLGYLDQDGLVKNTNFQRFNIRANISSKVTDKITVGLNIAGSRSNERYIPEGSRDQILGLALWADPREPVYNSDGTFNSYLGGGKNGAGDLIFGSANPVQILQEVKNTRNINRLLSNAFVEIELLKDLKFKSSVNLSLLNTRINEFRPSTVGGAGFNNPPPRNAVLTEGYVEGINWSADQLLSYSKEINGVHKMDFLLGYTSQEATDRNLYSQGVGFPDDQIRFIQNAKSISSSSGETSWSLLAYFARADYSFKNKYLLSATYRREGSSRFGSNNRWGTFPSVSVSWRLSEEAFLKDVSWVDDLKLRASYGVTGNNNIGNYSSLSTLRTENYILNGSLAAGKVLSSLPNTNLGWEQSNQFDYGLDLSVLGNRLTFVAEYYKKTTTDMLLPVTIPVISGFETTFTNIGKVQNTGVELGANYRTQIGNGIKILGSFNISFNRNKVLDIDGKNNELQTNYSFYGTTNVAKVGRPIGMLYGYRNLGVFNSVEEINASPTQDGAVPGSFKYFDADGNGIVSYDTKDWVEIGNPNPDFIWAFTGGLEYRGFDFNFILTGAQNYDVYRNIESTTLNLDGVFNVETRAKNRWRSPEQPGNGSIPTSNYWKWERESNSFYVHDASHTWVKSITLGYRVPLKQNFAIRSARVYINGDNMFLLTKFPGGNPQVSTAGGVNPGVDDGAYPLPRTITLGANLTF